MFRPLLGLPQAFQENRSKSCLCFTTLWDRKCLQLFLFKTVKYISLYTGLFISPYRISKIDCEQPSETRQKEAYQWIENISKFLSNLTAARYVHPW